MTLAPDHRIGLLATIIIGLDQLTKLTVIHGLGSDQRIVVLEGFFQLVHWRNTGAAWSLFKDIHGSNQMLAIFSLVALLALLLTRHHFEAHTRTGQVALGLIFGGIVGNLIDRLVHHHVVDFLYFYVHRRGGGGELGFPAFNIADASICTGVGLIFLLSLRSEQARGMAVETKGQAP